MDPRVVGGLVATAPRLLGRLAHPARDEHGDRAYGFAVRAGPFEAERHEMPRPGSVVEEGERPVLAHKDEVDPAVVVEVSGGQAAPDAGRLPGGPGAGGH